MGLYVPPTSWHTTTVPGSVAGGVCRQGGRWNAGADVLLFGLILFALRLSCLVSNISGIHDKSEQSHTVWSDFFKATLDPALCADGRGKRRCESCALAPNVYQGSQRWHVLI